MHLNKFGTMEKNIIEIETAAQTGGYQRFAAIRKPLCTFIRHQTPEKERLITEITDALIAGDKEPKGLIAIGFALLGLAHKLKANREKRTIFTKTTNSLLEKIHDPDLDFRMEQREILDTFQANGMPREKVSVQQIQSIYVHVLEALKTGKLRDKAWQDPLLLEYTRYKIDVITRSRDAWQLTV